MKASKRSELGKAYIKFCSKQSFIPSAVAKDQGDAFLEGQVAIDKYEKLYYNVENDNPFLVTMFKPATLTNFITLLDKVDSSKEGQVYLLLLISSFYSRFLFSMYALSKKMEQGTDLTTNDLDVIGFTRSNLNKISKIETYVQESVDDFNALTFDTKQLAYLKATAMKVCRLGGGVYE